MLKNVNLYRFLNINGSNYVYVGLTIDTLRRDQQHKNNKSKNTSSVFKFSELHNIEILLFCCLIQQKKSRLELNPTGTFYKERRLPTLPQNMQYHRRYWA